MSALDTTRETFPRVFTQLRIGYLGIAAPMVWIWCVLHRPTPGFGGIEVVPVAYLSMAVTLPVLVGIWKLVGDDKMRVVVGWPPAVLAAVLSAALAFPHGIAAPLAMSWAILGGVAGAGMLLSWAAFFADLDIRNAIASAFGAMIVSELVELCIDLMPAVAAGVALACVAIGSPYLLAQARDQQPPVDTTPAVYFATVKDWVPYVLMFGVGVCSFITGVAPRVPVAIAPTPLALLAGIHHIVAVVVALVALWWVFLFKRRLHFTNLWRTIIIITATGLLFLPNIGERGAGWALVMIAIAESLMVALLVITLSDASRHSSISPYVIWGFALMVHSGGVGAGQLFGVYVASAASGHGISFFIEFLAWALTLTSVLSLNDRNFIERKMFADLEAPVPERSMFDSIDTGCRRLGEQHGLTEREVEVLQLICKGRSKSYIADTLFISENTVRSHSRHIYQKLDVHSKQDVMDLLMQELSVV